MGDFEKWKKKHDGCCLRFCENVCKALFPKDHEKCVKDCLDCKKCKDSKPFIYESDFDDCDDYDY